MNSVFGPVISRRLGRSLGIDPLVSKCCDWSCVYCQLGRTRHRCTARLRHRPVTSILEDLEKTLDAVDESSIDWITLVGSGETTLFLDLGDLVAGIRARTTKPIALITNGSLLGWPDLRAEIADVDAVLPSLDAGSEELFQRINAPALGLTLEDHVAGLCDLSRTHEGRIWLEIMLLHGLNTSADALEDLCVQIARIQPDAVHVVVPTRPCAEPWVRAADASEVARAAKLIARVAPVLPPKEAGEDAGLHSGDPVARAVEIVKRHPVSDAEMRHALASWTGLSVERALSELRADPWVRTIRRGQQVFWVPATGDYREERSEPCCEPETT